MGGVEIGADLGAWIDKLRRRPDLTIDALIDRDRAVMATQACEGRSVGHSRGEIDRRAGVRRKLGAGVRVSPQWDQLVGIRIVGRVAGAANATAGIPRHL